MNTSKRLRQSILINEKNFATSTSAFIETKSISQTTDNHKKSSQANQLVDLQQQTDGFYSESKLVEDHYEIISKLLTKNKHMNANITKTIVDKTQSNSEDDWVLFNSEKNIKLMSSLYIQVCPVAVALRRAGYNVCVLSNLHLFIYLFFKLNRYHSDLRNLGLNVVSKPLIF